LHKTIILNSCEREGNLTTPRPTTQSRATGLFVGKEWIRILHRQAPKGLITGDYVLTIIARLKINQERAIMARQ
jgi:hypothetical protein